MRTEGVVEVIAYLLSIGNRKEPGLGADDPVTDFNSHIRQGADVRPDGD